MALWQRFQRLPDVYIRKVYGDHFPVEVRHYMSIWIEDNLNRFNEVNVDDPSQEQLASQLVCQLLSQLENKANSLPATEECFVVKHNLTKCATMLRSRYGENPLGLVRLVQQSLLWEMQMVNQFEMGGVSALAAVWPSATNNAADTAAAELYQQLQYLRQKVVEAAKQFEKMKYEQESFAIQYHECSKLNATIQHLANQRGTTNTSVSEQERELKLKKEMTETALTQKISGLLQMRLALADKHRETIQLLGQVQSRVLDDELIRWKRAQQLGGNGAPFSNNLEQIQDWCEELSSVIWDTRHQIKEVERLRQRVPIDSPGGVDILPHLNQEITQLLSSLVTSTFVIERQPPQVMKTNTRFTSTVRLLVGVPLNVHMTPPPVKVTIISESQANILLKNDKMSRGEASGDILNNTGTMEYQQSSRQLVVNFRNMQLRKIKRAEKKGTESVMDEKFSLLFQSQFNVGGGELMFQVWTLSLPVVVIVHGNQEPHAWATITWDNAFAEPGRLPFLVPDRVSWPVLAEVLNVKFRAATGRGLNDDNLQFLAFKLFNQMKDFSNCVVSWNQFAKEPLSDRTFTFWEWLYAVMKLTREHLRGPWNDGLVMGFVARRNTEAMLMGRTHGTFLLRFSDSELGGITIAWVAHENNEQHVYMLQPFTNKDFVIRSVADRLNDLKHLVYLYPDLVKNQYFSKYYTPANATPGTSSNGYIKPLLVTHIPGLSSPSAGSASPVNSVDSSYLHQQQPTPQSGFYPQSPDTIGLRDPPSVGSSLSENVNSLHCMDL